MQTSDSYRFKVAELMLCNQTDARVQTVTESKYEVYDCMLRRVIWHAVLGVVRMIKLFGWEPRVVDEVAAERREELRYVRQVRMRQFLMNYVK